ncbi:MAG: hypothetical protein JWM41_2918 [Gemmatimonadetes bacterium]|nr:hypothetical protein [Gemmatimonadota bacterium]
MPNPTTRPRRARPRPAAVTPANVTAWKTETLSALAHEARANVSFAIGGTRRPAIAVDVHVAGEDSIAFTISSLAALRRVASAVTVVADYADEIAWVERAAAATSLLALEG